MTSEIIISADTHLVEPPDLWTNRLPSRFKEAAPQVRRLRAEDGTEFDSWFVNGALASSVGVFTAVGERYEEFPKLDFRTVWEDVRPGAYKPAAMIEDLERDGIWGATVQPSYAIAWYGLSDASLISAIFRTCNDWVAEFCKPHSGRLRGIGVLNVDDVLEACAELRRCADLGLAGMFIPTTPLAEYPYRHPIYERLWWTAQDLGLPLIMHIFTQRAGIPGSETSTSTGNDVRNVTAAGMRPTADYWVRYSMCSMIFAGIFERYPRLKVGCVEHEASWIPHWLRQMDFTYKERPVYSGFQSKEGLCPSDYWRRNFFVNFQEDPAAVRLRDLIGVDTMMWGNDYPHAESTWPRSQVILSDSLAGVPHVERRKMLCENAASIFKFRLPPDNGDDRQRRFAS